MALESYTKAPVKVKLTNIEKKAIEQEPEVSSFDLPPVTNSNSDSPESPITRFALKNAKFVFPLLTGLIGLALIIGELTPLAKQVYAEKFLNKYDNEIVAVSDPKILGVENVIISDPDSTYFKNLIQEIESRSKFIEPPDTTFNDNFQITIPAINANKFAITSNVDSYDEKEYRKILEKTLAHFKGTSLPFQTGNSVIYGHSASGISGSYTGKYIFSKLSNLKIGDDITIDIKDKQIKYTVVKTKIVDPEDLSIIDSDKSRRTLTLVTCYPNGSSSKRMVVVAEEI